LKAFRDKVGPFGESDRHRYLVEAAVDLDGVEKRSIISKPVLVPVFLREGMFIRFPKNEPAGASSENSMVMRHRSGHLLRGDDAIRIPGAEVLSIATMIRLKTIQYLRKYVRIQKNGGDVVNFAAI